MAVKAAWAQQCWVEHVSPVGCRQDNHVCISLKAVHLYQNLVQRLLALVVTAAHARATLAPHSVNLINEDNGRRILLGLSKEVAYPACPHTNKHLYKL